SEAPKAEKPKAEEPEAEKPKTEEPKAEKPKTEEPKAEAPKSEAPKAEEPKAEKPKPVEPKAEKAKAEETKAEAPKSEKVEAPKADGKKEGEPAEAVASEGSKEEEKKEATTVKDLLSDGLGNIKVRRAKGSKNITHGVVHVIATFNNTKVTVTDTKGNVISWSSAGKCNFRGSRKSTAYAAQVVTQDATRAAMAHGLKEVEVHLKGPGLGRDSAVRALQALGMIIVAIVDKTPVPHNGCRPPKRRRV
ncbi:MAG: 30S ribosomal protein S11, partial [Verrucomicrobia bacterium]|nr:30S ribosomal protein S11 [Verrucomicrobiota bacterium]